LDDDVEAPRFQSRIKKGEIDEKASYFSLSTKKSSVLREADQESEKELKQKRKLLILLDNRRSQENMESRQNHFWYALIAPPFPPLSPPIQCLPGLLKMSRMRSGGEMH
jgi:hypothetical protein